MGNFKCPLCGQDVSKNLYEKITGIWKEKEKQMSALKAKERALLAKEKKLKAGFEQEKKKITRQLRASLERQFSGQQRQLKRQVALIKKEKAGLEASFRKKISVETNRILRQERARQKGLEKTLKLQFEKAANEKIQAEHRKIEKENKLQRNRHEQLARQFRALQKKSMKDMTDANRKIKLLEEQVKKNETPSMLGLLEETVFLNKLKEAFPGDKYEHTGKGGDIVHHVMAGSAEVGVICYELKKVSAFNKAHVTQAYKAKQLRKADYGMLVTNAKRKKDDMGFFVEKGVIIIHPAGAIVLISILRDHLLAISKLKLSRQTREKTINAVLSYIQGPVFKNGIESIIVDTVDLYNSLKKEVKNHVTTWEERLDKYRNIHGQAHTIESKVINLLVAEDHGKKTVVTEEIKSIDLPKRID